MPRIAVSDARRRRDHHEMLQRHVGGQEIPSDIRRDDAARAAPDRGARHAAPADARGIEAHDDGIDGKVDAGETNAGAGDGREQERFGQARRAHDDLERTADHRERHDRDRPDAVEKPHDREAADHAGEDEERLRQGRGAGCDALSLHDERQPARQEEEAQRVAGEQQPQQDRRRLPRPVEELEDVVLAGAAHAVLRVVRDEGRVGIDPLARREAREETAELGRGRIAPHQVERRFRQERDQHERHDERQPRAHGEERAPAVNRNGRGAHEPGQHAADIVSRVGEDGDGRAHAPRRIVADERVGDRHDAAHADAADEAQHHQLLHVLGPERQQHRQAEIERAEHDGEFPAEPVGHPAVEQRAHEEAEERDAEHRAHVLRLDVPVAQDGRRRHRQRREIVAVGNHHAEAERDDEDREASHSDALDRRIHIDGLRHARCPTPPFCAKGSWSRGGKAMAGRLAGPRGGSRICGLCVYHFRAPSIATCTCPRRGSARSSPISTAIGASASMSSSSSGSTFR